MPEVTEEIQTAPDPRRRPQPEEGPLTIIYEDDSTLVVNKPPGVVVHPTYKNSVGHAAQRRALAGARSRRRTTRHPDSPRQGHVGLVVIALTPGVHAIMQKDAAAGRTRKQYLAIVCGLPQPDSGQHRAAACARPGRSPARRRQPGGAPCETRYEVLSDRRVACRRSMRARHRTHASDSRAPGGAWMAHRWRPRLRRTGLANRATGPACLARLTAAPVTRMPLEFEAPLPDDMSTRC